MYYISCHSWELSTVREKDFLVWLIYLTSSFDNFFITCLMITLLRETEKKSNLVPYVWLWNSVVTMCMHVYAITTTKTTTINLKSTDMFFECSGCVPNNNIVSVSTGAQCIISISLSASPSQKNLFLSRCNILKHNGAQLTSQRAVIKRNLMCTPTKQDTK